MVDSKAAKELAIKLRKLWDNDNYVKGVIAFAKTEKIFLRYLNLSICHMNWKKISLQMIFHSYWKF